uniref:Ankyrin repeat domain-containing protein n=1 Tax=Laticauda laticaudata TaxID=8630 RepID=A0A8C5SHE2_LATLA
WMKPPRWAGLGPAALGRLGYGADVDALDKEGHLALHQSSWQGHGSTAHLLLARGAQPNHSCSQGATTQGVAMQEGWADVVKVLLQHRASPDVWDKAGHTPRWLASKRGKQAMLNHQATV